MQIIINQQTTWIVAYGHVLVHVELPKHMVQSPLVGYLFLAWHSQPLPEQKKSRQFLFCIFENEFRYIMRYKMWDFIHKVHSGI